MHKLEVRAEEVERTNKRLANEKDELVRLAQGERGRTQQLNDDLATAHEVLELAKSWYDADGKAHWCSQTGLTKNVDKAACRAICIPARAALPKEEDE